VLHGGYLL